MKDFYKNFFDNTQGRYLPKNLAAATKLEVDACILRFLKEELGCKFIDSELCPVGRQQLVNSMMMFVFAHRHTKEDLFLI
jgi:hypothetical protein